MKRASSNATQAKFLLQRFTDLYWRTASYNLTRIGVFTFLGLIFDVSFANVDYETYQGINGGAAMIFMSTFFVGMISFNSVIPLIGEDRAAFYRERASQTYSALWYFVGGLVIEIPYVFGSTLIFSMILFALVVFQGLAEFFLYWFNTAIFVLMMTYGGMLLAYALPSVEVATIIGVLVHSIFANFVGFNPPVSAIPQACKWLYTITPHRYTLEAMATVVFGNCPSGEPDRVACALLQQAPPTVPNGLTVAKFIDVVYGMNYDNLWRDFFVILACTLVFNILALISLRFINHQKR